MKLASLLQRFRRPAGISQIRRQCLMELDDVSFAYHPPRKVLQGVSLDVQAGQLTMLVGPNGCGKSTLLKLMLGHLRPQEGAIYLETQPFRRVGVAARAARIAYVPQRSSVVYAFTVRQVIEMGRFVAGGDGSLMDWAIDLCDLRALENHPCMELSVGQQQRVLLARAMVQAADRGQLLLLDEPTSAMDLRHVHETMHHLRELVQRGLAVVMVVQELNLAAKYADQVWLMNEGRIVKEGPWDQVLCPEMLESVYGVKVNAVASGDRPVFDVELRIAR